MKICLINPPIEDFYITSVRRQPLGLLYLFSAARTAGHDVTLINCHTPKKKIIPVPGEFSYLEQYRDRPAYAFPFKNYYHFGMSWQETENRIKQVNADVYCISALFTPYYKETDRIISLIKTGVPNAKIVVGGHHAALHYQYYLENSGVDFVITGEGEESLVLLFDAIADNTGYETIPNLAYQQDGIIHTTERRSPAIDSLHFPARDQLLKRDFRMYKKKSTALLTSRGCPNACAFCTSQNVWGKTFRQRSIDSVLGEIDCCVTEYGINLFNFEDDNLFAYRERSHDFLRELQKYSMKQGGILEFTAMNGVSLEQVDRDIIHLVKQAGFNELNISLVSHSATVQKSYKRPFNSQKFKDVVAAARKMNMHVRAYYILGLPSQTKEEIVDTISFLKGLGIMVFPSVFYNVYAPREEWFMQRSSAFYNETEYLSRDDLLRFFHTSIAG